MDSPGPLCTNCLKRPAVGNDTGVCGVCTQRRAQDTALASGRTSVEPVSPAARRVNTPPLAPSRELDPAADLGSMFASTGDYDPAAATAGPPRPPRAAFPAAPGYTIVRRLGGGGMGSVFLAKRQTLDGRGWDRLVALKFAVGEDGRLAVEGVSAAGLSHPNILSVPTWRTGPGGPFLVMEYAAGGTLLDLVSPRQTEGQPREKKKGCPRPLPPELAARWVARVCDAVHAAHRNEHRVIHRDIKPSNIVLAAADGDDWRPDRLRPGELTPAETDEPFPYHLYEPKLCDFGLAKRLAAGDDLTQFSGALGTASYMPPEQWEGSPADPAGVDERADVYALGATLHHLLCGRPPFGGSPADVRHAVLNTDPPPLRSVNPDVPAELEAIVWKCLRKRREDRYRTAAEVRDELERFLADRTTVQAPRLSRLRRAWLRVVRHRRAVAACVLAVGIVAGGYVLLRERADPYAAMLADINAGRELRVITPGREPKWHSVRCGITAPVRLRDGSWGFTTLDSALVQLTPPVSWKHYRVRAEIRQLRFASEGAEAAQELPTTDVVGVYCVYRENHGPDGQVAHAVTVVEFRESTIRRPPGVVNSRERLLVEGEGNRAAMLFAGGTFPRTFDTITKFPGPWRSVEMDVSPGGVAARWDGGAGPQQLDALTRAASEDSHRGLVDQTKANHEWVTPQPWSPNAHVGLWANRSSVAVRSFTVTPLPEH